MKYSINEEERKTLGLIWEKTLQNFPEGTETDMEKSLADYIENCGLPETDEHGAFTFSAFISSIRVLLNLMFRQEIHSLCSRFQIMDFRPLFIAPALLCLDTTFNVDKQRYAALLFGSFRCLCALACNPFFDCFLCIICTEGF